MDDPPLVINITVLLGAAYKFGHDYNLLGKDRKIRAKSDFLGQRHGMVRARFKMKTFFSREYYDFGTKIKKFETIFFFLFWSSS